MFVKYEMFAAVTVFMNVFQLCLMSVVIDRTKTLCVSTHSFCYQRAFVFCLEGRETKHKEIN